MFKKLLLTLLLVFSVVKGDFKTYGEYTLCMADTSIGSFLWKIQVECDEPCLGAFMAFMFKFDLNKSSVCKKAHSLANQDIISVWDVMPGAEIYECEQVIGLPDNDQARALIEAENACIGIE
ncbi:hypothetical protein PPERSA_00707 [Pseudocohnilembus persalinus]|uniref:Uncharacterized protein n=1 Tax=Pseudocohnilembus persalinus TaxID=266149 RepID=A0A0V0QT00_PSEPJ|nr:hypothetical protein PPERSA_00707 [Pseudocohnilembus persalinus]|eukprot:KRX05406.1 hypothetical protein PPERSA_00707 [Pseudocohnilembus persalinus]